MTSVLKRVYLTEIKLHEDIPSKVLSASASLDHLMSQRGTLSVSGLLSFLSFHPLHVIKSGKTFKCFAGLRGYQLAIKFLSPQTKIQVIIHNRNKINIEHESSIEPLLSTLVYGLDGLAYDTNFLNIWKAVDPKKRLKIMPELNNKKNLETLLNSSQKRLTRKNNELISKLKKAIDKQQEDDSDV